MNARFHRIRNTHCLGSALSCGESHYAATVLNFFRSALENDDGRYGDISTAAAGVGRHKVKARILCKSAGLLAGIEEVRLFFRKFKKLKAVFFKSDGDLLRGDETVAEISGYAAEILRVERTVLNVLQRMSGIATLTRLYVQKAPKRVLITPTRKTLWGLIDKRACVVGGGGTHRLNLSDAVLIKDTHLELLDHDFEKLFNRLAAAKKTGRFLEVEVESVADAMRAAKMYQSFRGKGLLRLPFYLMLDNMVPAQIAAVVRQLKKRKTYRHVFLEASGGVNLKNISAYARSGVDIISVGALTHSAPALDFSLKINI